MKDRFQTITDRLRAVENESRQARADLKAALLALPDNPAVKRGGNFACGGIKPGKYFVIGSSELFARDNWTARFHDFKTQYQELCDFIDEVPVAGDVIERLSAILRQGFIPYRSRGRNKLHPEVCANVAKLLDIKLEKEEAS